MTDLHIERLVNKDIYFNQAPYRDNGTFKPTPGLEEIILQDKYIGVRYLTNTNKSLKHHREELLREKGHYRATYVRLENEHSETLCIMEKERQQIEEQLDLKKTELEEYKETMENNDVVLEELNSKQAETKEKPEKPKNQFWNGLLTTVVGFAIADFVVLMVQWQVLRYQMSLDEIWVRTGGVAALGVFVHLTNILYRKSGQVIYSFTQWFCFIMFVFMVLGPVTLNHFYPESTGTLEHEWSLSPQETSSEIAIENQPPAWIQLHRAFKEMAPVLLGIIVFLIAWLRDPALLFRQKDNSLPTENKKDKNVDLILAINKWKELKGEVHNLSTKNGFMKAQIQQKKTDPQDLIPLQDKLDSLDKKIKEVDESIESNKIKVAILIHLLQMEIKKYQTKYMNILSGDPVKQAILKPVWPEKEDIINHFKILQP